VEDTEQSKLREEVDGILRAEVPIFHFHPPVETNPYFTQYTTLAEMKIFWGGR